MGWLSSELCVHTLTLEDSDQFGSDWLDRPGIYWVSQYGIQWLGEMNLLQWLHPGWTGLYTLG